MLNQTDYEPGRFLNNILLEIYINILIFILFCKLFEESIFTTLGKPFYIIN